MTDISEESRSQDHVAAQGESGTPSMWRSFLLLAAAGAVVAGFAVLGYSSLYCRDLFGTVFWTILFGVAAPAISAVETPEIFWSVFFGYLAVVFIVTRYTPFRLTWSRFAIGIAAGYILAALITWNFVGHGNCGLA